ncbi:MAG: methylated-DNA--[protein]-cysteine S-methyltransferase [Rickettsiella sp.]|nr:methylated-DNA--[protein]-cysteine S-methyltransferase [Rickettsiella sp.]
MANHYKINKAKSKHLDFTAIIQTPLGKLGIFASSFLKQLDFLQDDNTPLYTSKDTLVCQIIREINQYFDSPNFQFTIPYQVTGTVFQKRVWNTLRDLPVGKTTTYGTLAKTLNTGARAIGNACRTNPLPLLIPCHRVLAKNGLGGFGGDRTGKKVAIKQWLLNHETLLKAH